jgi:uncharacterized membrane protein YhhN
MSILPFPGGLENSQNGLLVMAVLAALYYLLRPASASGGRWAVLKTIPVAAMALVAKDAAAPFALIAALALSALGDFLLAHEGGKPFLAGLTAFLAAHLAYVWMFLGAAGSGAFVMPAELWRPIAAAVIVTHSAGMARLLNRAAITSMRLPVLAYILAITLMGVSGAFHATPHVFTGVVLFIVSDKFLATERFLVPQDSARKALLKKTVWVTYVAAQMLILLGIAAR